jgi:peptidoglycan/xylan/chitin deacetylase (PgdA/CDA1 family)
LQRTYRATLPVLTYHSLDESESPVSVSPALFRRQMEFLGRQGWRSLSLDQALAGWSLGQWEAGSFLLTFDDGFEDFATEALPVLAGCGFRAIVFVVAEWVGRSNDWPGQLAWVPRRRLMDWPALATILAAGMEVGAHTMNHPHLSSLAERDRPTEVALCRQVIENRLSCQVRAFAYPYGDVSLAMEQLVAAHYQAGFGTRLGLVTPASRPAVFERVDTYYLRQPRLFETLGTGWLAHYLAFRHGLRWLRRWATQRFRGIRP